MREETALHLAQLTDVHLGPLPPFWPWHWNVKRVMGYVNFRTKRYAFDDPARVLAVTRDVRAQNVDHVLVTGDLANLGMPAEYVQSLEWLEMIGSPDDVTLIPGNHDVYTPLLTDPGIERWRAYMEARASDDRVAGVPVPLASGFPYVRTIGRFALICLNSAVYMPPGVPVGRLGADQIERFSEASRALAEKGYARIVLIHHPPLPEHGTRRGLRDASQFEAALIEVGAELVLHGHNHRQMISWRDTRTGPVAIIGAPATGDGRYNLYRVWRRPGNQLKIERTTRGVTEAGDQFGELERRMLDPSKDRRERII